jgi:hypothetical protein
MKIKRDLMVKFLNMLTRITQNGKHLIFSSCIFVMYFRRVPKTLILPDEPKVKNIF